MKMENRLTMQIRQIKTLLNDFKKAKLKCIELCDKLEIDLPKLEDYETLERQIPKKMDLLDHQGLVQLKNQLASQITVLYEAERQYNYQLQRNQFKPVTPKATQIALTNQKIVENNLSINISLYQGKDQDNDKKVERIASYILDLRRSMHCLSRSLISNWKSKQFLMNQPEYLTMKEKLERYKMREEELPSLIQKIVDQEVQKIINQSQQIQNNQQYIIVKVANSQIDNLALQKQKLYQQERKFDKIVYENSSKKKHKKLPLQKIHEEKPQLQKQLDLTKHLSERNIDLHSTSAFYKRASRVNHKLAESHVEEETAENANFVYVVRKISPESQLNSSIASSISSLRSMRKKIFDDDIWDQFQKI